MMLPDHLQIRRARVDEVDFLNELTGRFRLYWGYEPEFPDWEPGSIRVTTEFLGNCPVCVLEEYGRAIGYYGLDGAPPEMIFDKLLVESDRIGFGFGKLLWRRAVTTARDMGATLFTFAADPNAVPFYRAMGAE